MAEKPEKKESEGREAPEGGRSRENRRAAMYDKGKERKPEHKPEVKEEKRETEKSKGDGHHEMMERHAKERSDMRKSHEKERMDLHATHREEHRKMHGRHETAMKGMMAKQEEEAASGLASTPAGAEAPGAGEQAPQNLS